MAVASTLLAASVSRVQADVKLPAIFSNHMVLQRDMANPIWGWAEPGEEVSVVVDGKTKSTKAAADKTWRVVLDPLPVGGPHTIVIEGKNRLAIEDVLVGEVWICSGQSNMQWPVAATRDADLVRATAKYPQLRMITVPTKGTQEPQSDFQGAWQLTTPETVNGFTAVGFFFGLTVHQALGVPVGLIHDSWGGSACEAWIRANGWKPTRNTQPLMNKWREIEKNPE